MLVGIIIFSIILLISLIVLPVSIYGMGKEDSNREGTAYQTASIFTSLSVISLIISFIGLMVFILKSPSCCAINRSINKII